MSEHAEALLRVWIDATETILSRLSYKSGDGATRTYFEGQKALTAQLLEALSNPREEPADEPYCRTRADFVRRLHAIVEQSEGIRVVELVTAGPHGSTVVALRCQHERGEAYLPTKERALDWLSRIVQESGFTLVWDDASEGEESGPRIVRAARAS